MQNSEKILSTTKQIGSQAEQIAFDYLVQKGFKPIERNFFYKKIGEIDLIMQDGEAIVFVEVRYRRNTLYGLPEATITPGKQRKIRRTAEAYLLIKGIKDRVCRFDVIGIDLIAGLPVIRHLSNCL